MSDLWFLSDPSTGVEAGPLSLSMLETMHSEIRVSDQPQTTGNSEVYLKEDIDSVLQLKYAFENEVNNVVIFLRPKEGGIPRNRPKEFKAEIERKVRNNKKISAVRFTRNKMVLFETNDRECAEEIVKIDEILKVPVEAQIQTENITSRFVLHNIDTGISLAELGTEIQGENGVKIKEIRRFTRKMQDRVMLTETVLVTIFGTRMPAEIQMFYMTEKV